MVKTLAMKPTICATELYSAGGEKKLFSGQYTYTTPVFQL